MALLAHQQIAATGTTVSYAAGSSGGDTVTPDDRVALVAKNTSGGAITVTVVVPGTYYGQALPDIAVSVPATTGEKFIAVLDRKLADPSTGLINITYSSNPPTGLTIAAVRI